MFRALAASSYKREVMNVVQATICAAAASLLHCTAAAGAGCAQNLAWVKTPLCGVRTYFNPTIYNFVLLQIRHLSTV
jgi:hypothetical protein